jgi:polysaccharide biosynthesis/export protein
LAMRVKTQRLKKMGMPGDLRSCLHAVVWIATAFAAGQAHAQLAPTVAANLDEPQLQRRMPPLPSPQSGAAAAPEDFALAKLLPGTLLSMDTYGVAELSGLSLRLDDRGEVSVPMLGSIHLGGLTLLEAQQAIGKALLQGEILVNPVVQLHLVQFAAGYISVLGEVENPGRYQVIAPRSLAELFALAGGETQSAGADIEIQHVVGNKPGPVEHLHYTQHDSVQVLQSAEVKPGETVFVHRAGVIYVLGAVGRPGGYLMVNGGLLNVYQALSLAGGTTLDAARNGMYIIRPHGEAFQTIKVPFAKLASERPSEVQLQLNDVLYVPRSGMRVAFLDGSAIIGSAVGGAIYTAR